MLFRSRTVQWAQRLLAATPGSAPASPTPAQSRLPVPMGDRVVFVGFEDIDWIQAADQYVIVHAGTKEYLLRASLQQLAARLPRQRFVQIHRSHFVNVAKVREIARLRKGDAQVTLAGGQQLRVSRRYRRKLHGLLAS